MSLLVDANVLLRMADVSDSIAVTCRQATTILRQRGEALFLCAQVACEFWAAATRPSAVNGLGLAPSEAEQELCDFEKTCLWLNEPADLAVRWRRLVNEYDVKGKQAHDARLVAFMQAHGLTDLLTLNPTDFARYEGIRCVLPGDVR
jgi:predicted nucleic acid-binding protein